MSRLTLLTSQRNPRLREIKAAALDPRKTGLAVAEGIHLVTECFDRGPQPLSMLVSTSGRKHPHIEALIERAGNVECLVLSDGLYRDVIGVSSPAGIAMVFRPPASSHAASPGDSMLLDGIQDPGNVGTLMRTAAAAGVRNIHLGRGCAAAWSLKVLRAGQGAHFSLNIVEQADLLAVAREVDAFPVATVVCGGAAPHELDLTGPVAWLFGSEGAGLDPQLASAARARVTIPMESGSESLNVAAAAAICLFEARRQRLATKRPAPGGPLR